MDIRTLTYTKKTIDKDQSDTNKWIKTDDTVFNDLGEHASIEEKIKIADLLNLFYYFIICYSKNCFKKDAEWNFKYKYFTHYQTKKYYQTGNTFDYHIANELQSHTTLLKIQRQLNIHRKDYFKLKRECNSNMNMVRTQYLTDERKTEMLDFIHESLYDIINFVAKPVKLVSTDIQAKINKYKDIRSKTRPTIPLKTSKINYDAMKAVLGDNWNSDGTNSSNMIQVSFGSPSNSGNNTNTSSND
jgi:hypothetical protein